MLSSFQIQIQFTFLQTESEQIADVTSQLSIASVAIPLCRSTLLTQAAPAKQPPCQKQRRHKVELLKLSMRLKLQISSQFPPHVNPRFSEASTFAGGRVTTLAMGRQKTKKTKPSETKNWHTNRSHLHELFLPPRFSPKPFFSENC